MESLTPEQNDAVAAFLTKARNSLLTTQGSSVDPAKLVQRLNTKGWISPSNAVDQMNQTINIYMGKVAGYVANQATKNQRTEAIKQLDDPPLGQRRFSELAKYAKRLEKEQGSDVSSIYYLKFGRGKIFDPWGTYAGRQKTGDWDWKKVSYSVWSRYIRYLASRNTRHLTHAERMIIDDSQK